MWYREAINLPDWKFTPVETSLQKTDDKSLTDSSLHKSVTQFHENRDEIDNTLQFGGLDPNSPFIVDYAEKLVSLIGEVVPPLETILSIAEQGHTLKWINFILLRFTSANWIIEDTKKFINLCNRVKNIQDPRQRIDEFITGVRKTDGLYGFIANSIMVFNTIVKGLKEFSRLDINNKWTFMAYFYGAPIARYLFEEAGDEEDKSGVKIIKKRIINPSLEFLFEKNSKNRDVHAYVLDLTRNNPKMSHDDVLKNTSSYFKNNNSNSPLDITEIVDLVYEDPHDLMGITRGRRISRTYYNSFVSMMSNSSLLQLNCLKATMSLSHMLDWIMHVKIASKNNWNKYG
jgi:hypothetical protein